MRSERFTHGKIGTVSESRRENSYEEPHLLQTARRFPDRHRRHRRHSRRHDRRRLGSLAAHRDRAQPHAEDSALRASRRNRPRATLSPKSPRRKARPPALAPPSSTLPEKFSPIPNPIPPTWRTTPAARNSPPPSPAKPARTSAAAPPSASHFSTSPLPSPEAPSASPIRSPMSKPCRPRSAAVCSGDLLIAFLIALLIAGAASIWTSRRLERIVDVAARIEQGDLRARVEDTPLDEIGRVAAAIDKTAGQVERSFAAVRSSQRQLETLLNSMQDAVIAVSSDGLVQWANQPMDRLVPQHTRLNAPVVETIRDPDFLAAVKAATTTKASEDHPRHFHRPRPRLRCHRRSPARWRRGRRASRSHRNRARRKNSPRFHRQRFPRTAHAADFDSGILRNSSRPQLRQFRITTASFSKSSARTPPACRASPKIC